MRNFVEKENKKYLGLFEVNIVEQTEIKKKIERVNMKKKRNLEKNTL